jgi:hypothetical protein
MAEEHPSLHVDTDWKKQAQEEKRRLVEQAASAAPKAEAGGAATVTQTTAEPGASRQGGRQKGQMPPASFGTLVQSLMTQSLFYLGDLATRGTEPTINLDMAKLQIDTLAMLEEKTQGNLTDDERKLLDTVLYETRMRYVSVASQYT